MPKNSTRTAQVVLPEELVADIDKLVGKEGRSAFLTEIAREEIIRRNQRDALQAAAGAWKDEDHPELENGSEAWVRKIRSESATRFQDVEERRTRQ